MANYKTILRNFLPDDDYDLEGIVDHAIDVTFVLEAKNGGKVGVVFNGAEAYCKINESYAFAVWDDAAKNSPGCGALTIVDGGDFMDYFHLQSRGIHKDGHLKHYVLFAIDDLVHVISSEPPTVKPLSAD